MNNRYLYRAKRADNGEWVEGFYAVARDRKGIQQHNILIADNDLGYFKWAVVDPLTICQCTGRTDEGEKLIFEHDIVSYLDGYSTDNGFAEAYPVGEVLWDDETLSFQVTERLSAESYEVLEECKVLGNIFDNPELLEVGEW